MGPPRHDAGRAGSAKEDEMSARSTAEKLGIEPDTTVWSSPPERIELIDPMPDGVRVVDGPERATTALVFVDDSTSARAIVAQEGTHLATSARLWVAYPKGNRTDINRDSLWPILAEHGMRPVAQVSIDEVWSAMRFRPLKEGETPFTGGGG
jgi:hypothetical protein